MIGNKKKQPWLITRFIKWTCEVIVDHLWFAALVVIWGGLSAVFKSFNLEDLPSNERIFVGITCILIILVILLVTAIAITYKDKVYYSKLIESFGIKGFYPYTSPDNRVEEWSILVDGLQESDPQNIKILALNGWETFSMPSSPLHEYLKAYKGSLTILLIDPECETCSIRRAALDVNLERFNADHKSSVNFCRDLKRKGIDVHLFYYSQQPIWKMISTETYVWLQHYDKLTHVEKSPVYEFYKDTDKSSMYFPLVSIIEKKTNSDGNKEVNLE